MLTALLLTVSAFGPVQRAVPVKVFILAGQSNMVGHGFFAADPQRNGGKGSLEHFLRDPVNRKHLRRVMDKKGQWRVRDDVWIHYFDQKAPLTVGFGAGPDCIGPELGFGHVVGDSIREPILLIKLAWGGKSLAVDFRPPSSGGTVGPYYNEVVRLTRESIDNSATHFPALKGRPINLAGFGWHQGWNDRVNDDFVRQYERNMANFIRDIRKDLRAPNLPFVIAETGMGGETEKDPSALALMDAQAAVARYPEFKSNVAFVRTRPFWRTADQSPSDQGYHWNNSGETYYLIGDAMGHAMLNLLKVRR